MTEEKGETQDFQDSIAQIWKERNDEWSEIVLGRLEYAQDLHAADAVYHQTCSVVFRTGKQVPLQHCSYDGSDKDKATAAGKASQHVQEAWKHGLECLTVCGV